MKYVNQIIMLYLLNRYTVLCVNYVSIKLEEKKIVLPNEGRKEKRQEERDKEVFIWSSFCFWHRAPETLEIS